jgi:hypothetical protein
MLEFGVMEKSLILTLIALSFISLTAQGESVQFDEDFNSVMNSILTPPAQSCAGGPAPTTKLAPPEVKTFQNFWHETSCEELFSERPPAWVYVLNSNISTESIERTWLPVCSLSLLADWRLNSKYTEKQLLERLVISADSEDRCPLTDRKELPAPVARMTYPLTEKPGLTPIKGDMQSKMAQIDLILDQAKEQAIQICCPDSLTFANTCRERISKIKIKPCSPNQRGCTNPGFAFSANYPKEPFTLAIGEPTPDITMNTKQLENENTPSRRTLLGFLLHELGHACSNLHIFHSLRGDLAKNLEFGRERSAYTKPNQASCLINSETQKNYRALFRGLITNQTAFDCILDVAQGATARRFNKAPCLGCGATYLEEAFAETFQIIPIPKTKEPAYATYYSLCARQRDAVHPFTPDILKCLLRDAIIRKKIEASIGCRTSATRND